MQLSGLSALVLCLLAGCASRESPFESGTPGPAGRLEHVPLVVEPPLENVAALHLCDTGLRWRFSGFDAAGVEQLFDAAHLESGPRASLRASMACDAGGCTLQPSAAEVAALSASQRRALYEALFRRPEDARPVRQFRHPAREAALWADATLSPAARHAIDVLSLPLGDEVVLPDPATLCALVPTESERLHAFQVLQRTEAQTLRLWVSPGDDLEALARYWGRGGREEAVRTVLRSVAATGERRGIDIDYLLPPMPRARLLTFPTPGAPAADCHWTALHFFDAAPTEGVTDWATTHRRYLDEFEEIPASALTFGDVVAFALALPDGEHFVHAAVFVADGVAFTKNGGGAASAWLLVPMNDLVARYGGRSVEVRYLRRRVGR